MAEIKQGTYYPALDTLRCLAVMFVLLEHWMHTAPVIQAVNFGSIGVDLFFVLSGFLITGILLDYRKKDEEQQLGKGTLLKTFFARRVLRIFPIYYVVVIVTTLANTGLIREAVVWNLTYTTNYFVMIQGDWVGNFGHFWSLAVEEQFYLFWPFIVLFLPRRWLLSTFGLLGIGALVYRYFIFKSTGSYVVSIVGTPACFDAFALGGILAYLARFKQELMTRILRQWWIPVVLIAAVVALKTVPLLMTQWALTPTVLRTLFSGIGFWLIGSLAFQSWGASNRIILWKPFIFIGQISYGMYLLHNFVPGFLLGLNLPDTEWVQFPVYLVCLILISWIANKLIERPFNKLKKRFTLG